MICQIVGSKYMTSGYYYDPEEESIFYYGIDKKLVVICVTINDDNIIPGFLEYHQIPSSKILFYKTRCIRNINESADDFSLKIKEIEKKDMKNYNIVLIEDIRGKFILEKFKNIKYIFPSAEISRRYAVI